MEKCKKIFFRKINWILLLLILHPFFINSQNFEDNEIVLAVESEIRGSVEISSQSLNIISNDGIVTLRGSVGNLLAKERVADVAKAIRGVRAVINLTELQKSNLTNEELSNNVKKAFEEHNVLNRYEFEFDVFVGTVEISGEVPSVYKKLMAENLLKSIPGVSGIVNMIFKVFPDSVSDESIAEDILYALNWDIIIDHTKIEVLVQDGNVIINGRVRDENKISRIESLVLIHGVKSLDVAGIKIDRLFPDRGLRDISEEITDEMIFVSVADVFLLDPRFSFFTPKIFVENKTITLGGVVGNLQDKMIAGELASNVVGAISVNNLIEVKPGIVRSDSAIQGNIISKIILDPFLAPYEITVNVLDGSVHLSGTVNNYFERDHATAIATMATGVIEVVNNIVVTKPIYRRYNDRISPIETMLGTQWLKTDFDLYNDITDRLFWNQEIHQGDVLVEVTDGHVVLRGIVDYFEIRDWIENVAIEEGALSITNKLDVRNR